MQKYLLGLSGILFFSYLIYYFFFNTMLVLGQQAPNFEVENLRKNKINLDSFKGQYVLIDFWGSWCAPCRQENKILTMMYAHYRDQKFKKAEGIQFLSIAFDQDPAAALKAIENDGLIWPHHVIEPNMFESQLAKIYKIKSIPAKYLIGPDQIIMLADPSIRELDDFLAFQILKN
ncbi:MAG: TlpA family protein disulfide reductase [Saprospiraceae bacterium]|nr:TlpA family protein disulfide reductase [Saprospiraceae bacterium]MBK8297330.1 TlpA family protein disulfide reductase [Saprospiraceae bacterium]